MSNETKTKWGIAVVYRCVRCGNHLSPRVALHTVKTTQREAMIAYGLPKATVDGFFPAEAEPDPTVKPRRTKPVEAALTSWPFPFSAHQELQA
ncbi:MAG TPA: hypothetical protein VLJ58_21595 [Ramlibacter sp.]|nr:hypothetical protein [Ramlibacter sp.]